MKYVSEQFQTLQNETIRPQLQLYFEVDTDVLYPIIPINEQSDIGFDDTVAPVVEPKNCLNDHFYAVLGDPVGVDDPNRICAPDNSGVISTPEISVPYGVTHYVTADSETLIGNDEVIVGNFSAATGMILRFKGLIPEQIRVEVYDTSTLDWVTEKTIVNTEMSEEVLYIPDDISHATICRFYVKNSEYSGRFQLLWIKHEKSFWGVDPIVFKNEYVSSVNVNSEIDLTSQTLPQHEMTVECLDVDEEYTPETPYWNNQFSDGKKCLLKAGYEIGGSVEYVAVMLGVLTKKPTYGESKITFNIEAKINKLSVVNIISNPDSSVSSGELVASRKFKDILDDLGLFDSYADIFANNTDENNSLCNFYGEIAENEAQQLVANALGGYIAIGIDTVELHNSNMVQYKKYIDYLTRSEQIQCTLESQPKVGKIEMTRYDYTLLSDYKDVQSESTRMVEGDNLVTFKVPFYSIGRMTARDFPSGYSIVDIHSQYANNEGGSTVNVTINKSTSGSATNRFTIRFYKVTSTENKEIEIINALGDGETYTNENKLITNSYVAAKAKGVARLMSNVSNQYEVDYMQDLRYELGDVIRLETQKGIYKTCVIMALQNVFPGSTGHLTLKKIFALEDTPESIPTENSETMKVSLETVSEKRSMAIDEVVTELLFGIMNDTYNGQKYIIVLGSNGCWYSRNGQFITYGVGAQEYDNNQHIWNVGYIKHDIDAEYTGWQLALDNTVELPDYDTDAHDINSNPLFYAINKLIEYSYKAQGMIASIDDSNAQGTIVNIWDT